MTTALTKEGLHFLGRLCAFLEVQDLPEGLIPNISISLDFNARPDYFVVMTDEDEWSLVPNPKED